MLLKDAIKLFLGEYRESTQHSYRYVLKNVMEYVGPSRPVDKIHSTDLVEYMQDVRSRESVKSPATVNKYVKTLKTFFNWCVRVELIDHSPAKAVRQQNVRSFIRKEKAMYDSELEQLLDYARFHPRLHALVLFFADSACRRRGAAGLRWSDIDFKNMTAVVTEKHDKTRTVIFGEAARYALELWRIKQKGDEGPYVFSKNGAQMTAESLGQFLRRGCQRAGIRSLGPHSLRHRKGHQSNDMGISPSITKEYLGHESVSITLEYYYPKDDERVREAAHKLAVPLKQTPKIVGFPKKSG